MFILNRTTDVTYTNIIESQKENARMLAIWLMSVYVWIGGDSHVDISLKWAVASSEWRRNDDTAIDEKWCLEPTRYAIGDANMTVKTMKHRFCF